MSASPTATYTLFDDLPYLHTFTARVLEVGEQGLALDQTLFYPTGGGQPGDQGHVVLSDGLVLHVLDTQRDASNRSIIWHRIDGDSSKVRAGATLQGYLDWERRYSHMRMHTCLHLLCSIIDAPVTGCSISADKGRLDFDIPEPTLDKDAITRQLNELVERHVDVRVSTMPEHEYRSMQAQGGVPILPPMAQGAVRVVEIPGLDIQPCGGTHVKNTAEIGHVSCEKIEKKSRHNRRVTVRFG